jgi:hypothetical protein
VQFFVPSLCRREAKKAPPSEHFPSFRWSSSVPPCSVIGSWLAKVENITREKHGSLRGVEWRTLTTAIPRIFDGVKLLVNILASANAGRKRALVAEADGVRNGHVKDSGPGIDGGLLDRPKAPSSGRNLARPGCVPRL